MSIFIYPENDDTLESLSTPNFVVSGIEGLRESFPSGQNLPLARIRLNNDGLIYEISYVYHRVDDLVTLDKIISTFRIQGNNPGSGWLPGFNSPKIDDIVCNECGDCYCPKIGENGFGNILQSALSWNGVDVKSNGNSICNCCVGNYGYKYQCVELIQRFYSKTWDYQNIWGGHAINLWDTAPAGIIKYENGSNTAPVWGDVLVFSGATYGHVAAVKRIKGNSILFVEQNSSADGLDKLSFEIRDGGFWINPRGSYIVKGWLHSPLNHGVIPYTYSPSGSIFTTIPTFKWFPVTDATKYQIQVYKGTSLVVNETFTPNYCSLIYEFAPGRILNPGDYKWRVRAYYDGSWHAYSKYQEFSILSPKAINSQFTGSMAGWEAKGVVPWHVNESEMYTNGKLGMWSNVYYKKAQFSDFDYSVSIKRTADANWANYITVRMGSDLSDVYYKNFWYPGYIFGFTNSGAFSVFLMNSDGSYTNLMPWTYTSAIKGYDWNILRVYAKGSTLKYYINDFLVYSLTDTNRVDGYVGIITYKGEDTKSKLKVDWAKLTILSPDAINNDVVSFEQEALNISALDSDMES